MNDKTILGAIAAVAFGLFALATLCVLAEFAWRQFQIWRVGRRVVAKYDGSARRAHEAIDLGEQLEEQLRAHAEQLRASAQSLLEKWAAARHNETEGDGDVDGRPKVH